MRSSKAVLPKMLAACPNVVSYTLSMRLSWSSNTIKLPPDVEIFPCFLRRPTQVPGPAAPLERAAIPADTGRSFLGDTHAKLLPSGEGQSESFTWEGERSFASMEEDSSFLACFSSSVFGKQQCAYPIGQGRQCGGIFC